MIAKSFSRSFNKKKKKNFKYTKKGKSKAGKCESKRKDKYFLYSKKGHSKKKSPNQLKKNEGTFHSLLV